MTITAAFPPREPARPPGHDRLAALRLSLRRAADADWPFLQGLYASFRADEMAYVAWPPAQKEAFLNDQVRLQHHHFVTYYPGADFWIAEHALPAGAVSPIGRLYLHRVPSLWRLIDIGFLPEARGQGFGTALLRWAQTVAAEMGAAGIDLHVLVPNFRAQALYDRLGFKAEGTAEGYHQRMVWHPAPQLNTA